MILMPAHDFETVKSVYIDVIAHTPEIEKHARWEYGKHPSDELLRSYMENDEMYFLVDGERTAGVVAIVMHQGQDYHEIAWAQSLADDEVATIHLLAVVPDYRGQSLGKRILEEAAALAAENGKKAIRLDVLKSNLPAQHMYQSAGFSFRGTQYLFAENTAWTDFLYYEKTLISGKNGVCFRRTDDWKTAAI